MALKASTKKEIEAEYDYVSFPLNKLQQLIDLQNECELNGLENQTYDIILGKKSQIKITIANTESSGGEDILIKSKTQVSFYFNKNGN